MRTINYLFALTCLVVALSISQIYTLEGRGYTQHDYFVPTPLAQTWSVQTNNYAPAYFKDYNGIVRLRGVAKLTSGSLPALLFTLPEGFRPATILSLRVATQNGRVAGTGVVNITKDGDVIAVEGQSSFSLDSITFSASTPSSVLAAGSSVSTNLRFPKPTSICVSYWQRFWSPRDPTIRVCQETELDGEILLTGSVSPITQDSTSVNVAILDRPQRPNRDIRVCAPSTKGTIYLLIRTTGDVLAKGYKGGSVFLDGINFLKDQVTNWREVPQWKNGYKEAQADFFITDNRFKNVYTTPGFRKDGEGRIFLKGIVAPPQPFAAGIMFVLPEGYRPSETVFGCGATRRGYVTVSVNPAGEVAVESIYGTQYIDWLSLDGISFLGSDTQGELVAPGTTLKFYDVDTLFTSVEGSFPYGTSLKLTRPPLRNSGYFAFVQNTPVLVKVNTEGDVKVEEFPRVDSDTVLFGNDWKPLQFFSQSNNIVYDTTSERPSFMLDRNNNLVILRGLFPHKALTTELFSLPSYVQVEKEVLVVASGTKNYFPLVVRTTGQVEWAGDVPEVDTLILLDGLNFPAVLGEEPPFKHIDL